MNKNPVRKTQNGEYFLRINYLYQLAHNVDNTELSRYYIGEMRNIAKRQVLRL